MYLAQVDIENFRRLKKLNLKFRPGLNVLVGANNVGKTAVIDALRSLLGSPEETGIRVTSADARSVQGQPASELIKMNFVFRDLTLDEEADFLPALVCGADGEFEAHFAVQYSDPEDSGRLRPRRSCGRRDDIAATADILGNLRAVYLPPLRDASYGLRPGRMSQLARLVQAFAKPDGKANVEKQLAFLDAEVKKQQPIADSQAAVETRHRAMLGDDLALGLDLGLSALDFQKLAARTALLVDTFEVEQNGLGYNNLIYMAVVLSELSRNKSAAYRGLIVEEPEAHLHPQLQAVLLRYLETVDQENGDDRPVQVFVTSHSPHFASLAQLDALSCLFLGQAGVEAFSPRDAAFQPGEKAKLQRYLDVTRAELFFASRIVLVEGAAERILLHVLSEIGGFELRRKAVSVISMDGLNFNAFLPLFGEAAMKVPVAILTDADPPSSGANAPAAAGTPSEPNSSSHTAKVLKRQDSLVRVFFAGQTLEYDLALIPENRPQMVQALKALHPRIAEDVESAVARASSEAEKARALFDGMFKRTHGKDVHKGTFAQELAQVLSEDKSKFRLPPYITDALEHVCG